MAAKIRALDIWMNGHHVGRWERTRSGSDQLTYDREWMESPEGRPLSLSLPFTDSAKGKAGPLPSAAISSYFDNLLPDNDRILRRLAPPKPGRMRRESHSQRSKVGRFGKV